MHILHQQCSEQAECDNWGVQRLNEHSLVDMKNPLLWHGVQYRKNVSYAFIFSRMKYFVWSFQDMLNPYASIRFGLLQEPYIFQQDGASPPSPNRFTTYLNKNGSNYIIARAQSRCLASILSPSDPSCLIFVGHYQGKTLFLAQRPYEKTRKNRSQDTSNKSRHFDYCLVKYLIATYLYYEGVRWSLSKHYGLEKYLCATQFVS